MNMPYDSFPDLQGIVGVAMKNIEIHGGGRASVSISDLFVSKCKVCPSGSLPLSAQKIAPLCTKLKYM